MATERRSSREQLARDLLITILAFTSVAIGIELLNDDDSARSNWLEVVDFLIVVFFWVDFVRELRQQKDKRAYLASHWWELPSLIPTFPALVALFPGFALIRVVRLLRIFRVIGVLLRLRPAGGLMVRLARDARLGQIFGAGAIVVFLGTLLAHALEAKANPDMASWGQSLWFAFNMCTNVAYLDYQPVTTGGRVLSGVLQVFGIAFIGIFTASLAGAIVRDVKDDE